MTAAIETGAELKAAREVLGLSLAELADRLRLRGGHKAADHLREMEEGRRELTGPIAVAVELLLRVRELELEAAADAQAFGEYFGHGDGG